MRALVVVACLSAVGCADGTSVLTLSVTSDAVVSGVDHVVVQLTDVGHNRVAKPVTVSLPDAPAMIPPVRTVALVLPATLHGAVHLDVTAYDVDGAILSTTAVDTMVSPSKSQGATATLPGGAPAPDLGGADMTCMPCPTVCCPASQQCGATGCCTPGGPDLPDNNFTDSNCDGVDGNAADAVFVDPTNGNDTTGDGTRPRPLQHLGGGAGALALAQAQKKHQILISTGTIHETATIALFDGIGLFGGYDAANGWNRSDANARPSLVVTAANTAVLVPTQTLATYWDRIDVSAATAATAGQSSYAMFVNDGDLFTLSNATLVAGDGAPGVDSTTPAKQSTPATANGAAGSGSIVATCCVSVQSNTCVQGPAGVSSCGGFAGGKGNPCGSPAAPVPGTGPSPGTGGGPNGPGGMGGSGAAGADAAAPPTAMFGSVDASGYAPPLGTIGSVGAPGSGGGGGGFNGPNGCTCNTSVTTLPGGGGGAGGCGGVASTAAAGGGGSFALYLWNANPTLDAVKLVAGNGGAGGKGALGAPGQDGGSGGGPSPVLGGVGGSGGRGGSSSGGLGGPSICLEQAGTSMPTLKTTPIYVTGTGGAGGVSPNPAISGLAGVSASTRTN